ncbi:ADP-ribosylation_factor like protein 2a [Hexamita inflata]|uniref:ADP-ribosylation factor like protein 2a n=1 Tax=Hexamita inflata TaxID=28002 RepID=A0AA86V056_9EUKA|nr:ADP-ribosylation factor like protein 2a [Hexamita inflata]
MGSILSTNVRNFLMVGKYDSGKSSIIKIIAPRLSPMPMIGLNSNIFNISKSIQLTCFSVFSKKYSDQYKIFCNDITGLIFVLDSSCIDDDVKYYLDLFMEQQEVRNSKILILANKCDLENAMTKDEIYEKLNLESYKGQLLLQICSAVTKQGIKEGIKWLKG